jgi:hypothetical protein
MTTDKILQVVDLYRERFIREGIRPRRMGPREVFKSPEQMLSHAHYLLDGITEYAQQPDKESKTGRHLGSAQTLLWVPGWYNLEDLMSHNRPD